MDVSRLQKHDQAMREAKGDKSGGFCSLKALESEIFALEQVADRNGAKEEFCLLKGP